MDTPEPVEEEKAAAAPPGAPRPARPAARWMIPAAVLTVICGALAGLSYRSYAGQYLRTAKAPRCAIDARVYLKEQVLVSGTEPHALPSGETAYLTEPEDHAVRCIKGISKEIGAHLTAAFTEQQPEIRALELLKVVRDHVPPDPAHDREAAAGFYIVRAAMQPIPDLPEKKAALEELELLHACRFDTTKPCPTRPPVPPWIWASGAVSAIGILLFLKVGVTALIPRIRAALRRRAERRAAQPPPPPPPARPAKQAKPADPARPTKPARSARPAR
jgi:hypothetical protein